MFNQQTQKGCRSTLFHYKLLHTYHNMQIDYFNVHNYLEPEPDTTSIWQIAFSCSLYNSAIHCLSINIIIMYLQRTSALRKWEYSKTCIVGTPLTPSKSVLISGMGSITGNLLQLLLLLHFNPSITITITITLISSYYYYYYYYMGIYYNYYYILCAGILNWHQLTKNLNLSMMWVTNLS